MQPPKGAYANAETWTYAHRRRPVHCSGQNWFDPLRRDPRIPTFASAPTNASSRLWWRRKRKRRTGRATCALSTAAARPRVIATATGIGSLSAPLGALTVSLPRVRLLDGDGGEKEWRSQTIQAYKRLTKRAEAPLDYRQYVPCRHQHAPCPPSAGRPVRGQGRQGRGEPRLAQGKDRLGELAGSGLVTGRG